MSRFPGNIPPPIARPVRREAGNGPPKAQPARKRSGKRTAAPDGLWRAASQGAHRRGAVPASGARSLRSQDRGAVGRRGPPPLFFGFLRGRLDGLAHTALRDARRRRRPHGRLRRLGHAGQLRLADRGASRRAARRRHVRRLAHVRRRPARRSRARVPAAAARQRRRQAHGAGQGALLVHAAARPAA